MLSLTRRMFSAEGSQQEEEEKAQPWGCWGCQCSVLKAGYNDVLCSEDPGGGQITSNGKQTCRSGSVEYAAKGGLKAPKPSCCYSALLPTVTRHPAPLSCPLDI